MLCLLRQRLASLFENQSPFLVEGFAAGVEVRHLHLERRFARLDEQPFVIGECRLQFRRPRAITEIHRIHGSGSRRIRRRAVAAPEPKGARHYPECSDPRQENKREGDDESDDTPAATTSFPSTCGRPPIRSCSLPRGAVADRAAPAALQNSVPKAQMSFAPQATRRRSQKAPDKAGRQTAPVQRREASCWSGEFFRAASHPSNVAR